MNIHEKYVNRCIQLAKNGLGTTYPNPMVGSVVVYDDTIIGEGWHRKAGEPHAEVHAINSVKDKSLLSKATIYVSLEPCSHYGKTPPCSDLIIDSGIRNVVIGIVDPFADVAGRGVKKLVEAGCNVTLGVLEDECRELNKRFFCFHDKYRPYIILKWAESADGYISPEKREHKAPVWISNIYSRQLVHRWRSEEQAILIGTQTAILDNPSLSTRDWFGKSPVRLILDKNLRIPQNARVYDNSTKTIVLTEGEKRQEKNTFFETVDFGENLIEEICKVLYNHGIQSLIVEGGRQTLQTFIDRGIWDEARIFKGNSTLGGGTPSPSWKGRITEEYNIADDKLICVKPENQ
ncbi:bifunctional diaminohydroxyphosphoribosylaminopyrimidine deaminase/5-amino-6-(5-phosphoribosylamino)uracil reductase RibD [Sinomicrobium sp.]